MKRIALFLACALLSLTLCSCAYTPANQQNEPSGTKPPVTEPTQIEDTVIESGTPVEMQQIMYESDDFLLTVDPVEFTTVEETTITVGFENRSEMDLGIYCTRMTINGWQTSVYINDTVFAGERCTWELRMDWNDYADMVYRSVDCISFDFEVFDDDNSYNMLLDETLTVYVSYVSEEEVEIVPRITTETETVVVDDGAFSFVVLGVYDIYADGFSAICYYENKTDVTLEILWHNECINGWVVDPHYTDMISPFSRIYTIVDFDLSAYHLLGIDQLSSVDELTFDIEARYETAEGYTDVIYETVCLYPTGLTAEDIPETERTPMPGEQVIADNEQFSVAVSPIISEEYGEYYAGVYVHNKGDTEIHLSLINCTLNEQLKNFHFGTETIPAGSSLCHVIDVDQYDLLQIDADAAETISFTVQILNEVRTGVLSEKVTIEPEA
ncbi:MAG: hypothetical protein E7554_05250 [Ruminococcaceae bacterium]|nr:hypothetical protein [Oscillospiraceae bacterium]